MAAPTGCAQLHGVIDDDTISVRLDGARHHSRDRRGHARTDAFHGGLRKSIAYTLSFHVRWTVTEYEHPSGEAPVLSFLQTLTGDAKAEAIALVRIITERGNVLREPLSKALGSGLFELRGQRSGVRIFYTFQPSRVIVLLDGIVKKRGDIPPAVLARVRRFCREVAS